MEDYKEKAATGFQKLKSKRTEYNETNVLKSKSMLFAIKLYHICNNLIAAKEYDISRQLLSSGTSIGANSSEARRAQSKADFIHKLSLAQKEAEETQFWLDFLFAVDLLDTLIYDDLNSELSGLYKIITSSLLTSKGKVK